MDINIIKQEVEGLLEELIEGLTFLTLTSTVNELRSKLLLFYDEQDKFEFCANFIKIGEEQLTKHESDCPHYKKGEDCVTSKNYQLVLSAAKQEIKEISRKIEVESNSEDTFSAEEIQNTSNSIDEIIELLKTSQQCQEIIFDEIQDLKFHMNLGKKKWKNLFAGTVLTSVGSGLIDKAIVPKVFECLDIFKKEIEILLP